MLKKYQIIALCFIGTLFFQNNAVGQTVLPIPNKYYQPTTTKIEDLSPTTDVRNGSYWIVYSDRENNKTYASPGGSVEKKSLNFMEELYVIGESNIYLHVAKDPDFDTRLGSFSNKFEDFGWIDKNNLLLWNNCIVSDNSKITKKAMILNTIVSAKELKEGESKNIVQFYKEPGILTKTGNESRLFNVFFIYKIDKKNKSYLLGKNQKITDKKNVTNDITGWVSTNRVNTWDHRIALEPNWIDDAATERKNKNKKAMAFNDELSASNYQKDLPVSNISAIWQADPYDKRNIGDWRRFPILQSKSNGIYRIGVMGEINSSEGVISLIEGANTQRKISLKRKSRRNINIVFVVDGTSSMGPYFKPIADAITESINELKETKNDISFGAVVYRDFKENENLCEIKKLTPKNKFKDVTNFLLTIFSDAKNKNDIDEPEAVYYGIERALQSVNMPKNETNIIVLVGDAGNHNRKDESQVDFEKLTELIVEKNCNFLVFQANNKGSQDYENFKTQGKNLMLASARKIYNNTTKTASAMKQSNISPILTPLKNNTFRLDNSAIIGRLVYCSQGSSISASRLTKEVAEIVKYSCDYTDKLLKIIDKTTSEGTSLDRALSNETDENDQYVNSFGPAVINFLSQQNFSEEQLAVLADEKYQMYIPGYASTMISGLEEPIFQKVLFLTRMELGELLSDISRIQTSGSGNEQRENMQNAWRTLLKQHIGDIKQEEIANTSMEDISKMVFGLPSQSKFLENIKLADIIDPAVMNDRTFQQYVSEIDKKYSSIKKIYDSDNYLYSFRSNDLPYYWIEQSMLP
jgi:hypothetical protein